MKERMSERGKEYSVNVSNISKDITMDPRDIKKIIRKYYEHLYANNFDKLNKIFLKDTTSKCNTRRNKNLSRYLFIKEINL